MEDLVLSCLESRVEENRNLYARFLVGPFLKGDALTVATALRRVLLSSIESIGITALYIQGITHEFSTIVGVRESVLELSLNFQAIVLSYDKTVFKKKSFFDDLQIGYLQVQGPKVIYANHLKLPLGVKLVDPTQYIATVSKEGSIVLKFIIGKKKAFLHQNTGPESFFGNLARDLPVVGKINKKNIVRAKKTCFYKKGSTVDWLPIKSSGQNVLQRQNATFTPRVFKKSRRSFTNVHFVYRLPIISKRKDFFGQFQGYKQKLEKKRLSLNFTGILHKYKAPYKSDRVHKYVRNFRRDSVLVDASGACKRTNPFMCIQNRVLMPYKYKSTTCKKICNTFGERGKAGKKICTCSRSQTNLRTNRKFVLVSEKSFVIPSLLSFGFDPFRFDPQSEKDRSQSKKLSFYKNNTKLFLYKNKAVFDNSFITKQRKLLTNSPFSYKPSYNSPICTCSSPLLRKKNEVKKKNDGNRKKVLFLKSQNDIFRSNICLRNVIPLDFTLTPILKVNFVVEIDDEVLYLRQKVRERIILEVWTNGSIHPRQAVHDAALSLTDIFSSFRSVYGAKS